MERARELVLVVVLCLLHDLALGNALTSPSRWQVLLQSARPAAQTAWGHAYAHGEGVPQDYRRAVALYCAAARRGNTEAQYHLGWLYANGRGVARDDALAAAWFRVAAAGGDPHSRRMLALVDDREQSKWPLCTFSEFTPEQNAGGEADRARVERWVRRLAPRYGLEPALVLAVIEAESSFDPKARSHKGALGLMQLLPQTAARFDVADPLNPFENLRGGMAYLCWLLAFYQGDVRLALAGYNAGEAAVERFAGVPPYAETRAYVRRIVRAYGSTEHPPVVPVTAPSRLVAQLAPNSRATPSGCSTC